jgi:hypothetical protein
MGVKIENRIFGKNWEKLGIYLNMKIIVTAKQFNKLLAEIEKEEVFHVGKLKSFHKSDWVAWNRLQKVLERKGNPPFTIDGNVDLSHRDIKSLGNLVSVSGSLDLYNTPIESLGRLEHVGGYLILNKTPIQKEYSRQRILSMIRIGGKLLM